MVDFTVSKHINGRDWHGNVETASLTYNAIGNWNVTRSTKKAVVKKVRGKAQELANNQNRTVTVDVYSGKGDFQKTLEITPTV